MYTCNHCKKKLRNVPYMCCNNRKYCSYKCVPDSTIEKPYSFQYFNLMDGIRDIELDIENIKTREDRIDIFKLYRCVVCGGWEPWERFTYYDNLKLYKCDEQCGCEEYDHLYQDEF